MDTTLIWVPGMACDIEISNVRSFHQLLLYNVLLSDGERAGAALYDVAHGPSLCFRNQKWTINATKVDSESGSKKSIASTCSVN